MNSPEISKNETSRISELHSLNILNTHQEKRFDRITRVASKVFQVPIALVSLVDENRLWFKSAIGLTDRESPREHSFCGEVILNNKIIIVENAHEDERYKDNSLVLSDPEIQFYAGCPLRTVKGNNLGTLCLLDRKPRKLSRQQISILKDLALMVERELELTKLAIMDELTQIPNRRGFKKLAEQSLNLSRRSGLPSTLVYFDLDNFKSVNKKYGRTEGDKVLMIFASNINKISRDSDIFARLGSDEFVILFIDTPKRLIEKVLLRFKDYLNRHLKLNSLNYDITYSYSAIEFMQSKHAGVDDMLLDADELMLLSKK